MSRRRTHKGPAPTEAGRTKSSAEGERVGDERDWLSCKGITYIDICE